MVARAVRGLREEDGGHGAHDREDDDRHHAHDRDSVNHLLFMAPDRTSGRTNSVGNVGDILRRFTESNRGLPTKTTRNVL